MTASVFGGRADCRRKVSGELGRRVRKPVVTEQTGLNAHRGDSENDDQANFHPNGPTVMDRADPAEARSQSAVAFSISISSGCAMALAFSVAAPGCSRAM